MTRAGPVLVGRRARLARGDIGEQVEHQPGHQRRRRHCQAVAPEHIDDVGLRVAGEIQLDRQKHHAQGAEQKQLPAGHEGETVEEQQEHNGDHQPGPIAE
ncbi:hypothetical protein D3C85_1232830 [compost metagenome]